MDFNTIQSLQEAYQQVNENLLGSLDKVARDTAGKVGGEIGAHKGRQTAGNIFGIPERIGRNKGTQQGQQMYDKAKETVGGLLKQGYEPDVFDVVLEFLQTEGYAETLEEAEWMMANLIDEEAIDIILGVELDEAEGSYGKTPESTKRWNKATLSRMNKPASEYEKRGDKKKEVAKYSKHNQRTMALDHDASRGPGKKSSRGVGGRQGLKMTQKDRDDARGQAEYGHTGYDPDWHGGPSAPGSKPKGKKAERQKKTGVSDD